MNEPTQRRLAAIVATDVVGYSRLMGMDEAGTLAVLRSHRRELIDGKIIEHGGRVVKTMGDGLLLEFPSVVNAVKCSVEVQEGMADRNSGVAEDKQIVLRIGVNLGDIIIDGDDILGDGINIAARLEGLSEPGGVCISSRVHEDVRDRLEENFVDGGLQTLKNIARPLQVWHWSVTGHTKTQSPGKTDAAPELPDKPSIAVLPFDNMSGDPEQEYFVDGMVEDILTTLSKVPNLFVIARNSSFRYKGKTFDIRDVGRELGVRYVVEGSVRKAGNRVRVTAQLIDSLDGTHVWADRYDGDFEDVFDLQDRLTREIVTALEVNLTFGEQVRIWRDRSGSPLVYEKHVKSRELYSFFARQTHLQARQGFEEALEINPTFIPSMTMLGYTWADLARFGWVPDREAAFDTAIGYADKILAVDPDENIAYSIICYTRTYQRRHEEAVAAAEKAVASNSNDHIAFHMAAMSHIYAGDFSLGRDYERQANRLSPIDEEVVLVELARAEYHLGAFEDARKLAVQVLQGMPHWLTAKTILLASLWRLGDQQQAKQIGATIIADDPKFSVARWSKSTPYRRAEDLASVMDPLVEAGLPE